MAALQVILEEAGGRFTNLAGVATPDGGSVVCTNGHLHDEVLAHLTGGSAPLYSAGEAGARAAAGALR
jgi:histidinol-phosphatase